MSLFHAEYISLSLAGKAEFNLVMPNDIYPGIMKDNPCYGRGMKTLFLLHGYTGNGNDWLLHSPVMNIAAKYNLALVMPSAGNSFYLDGKGAGKAFGRYVGEELVDYVRKTFGLAKTREDTYIGGLSMGGFGAVHTGLAFPRTFRKIIALSPAMIIHNIERKKPGIQGSDRRLRLLCVGVRRP